MGSCMQCRFVDFLDGEMACWKNAPTARSVVCAECGDVHSFAVQPPVQPDWWCGSYEPASIAKMSQTQRTWKALQDEIEKHYQEYLRGKDDEDHHDSNVVTLRNVKPKGSA